MPSHHVQMGESILVTQERGQMADLISTIDAPERRKIFSETVDADATKSFKVPNYSKEPDDFIRLKESLEGNFIFENLTENDLSDLIGAMQRETIPAGQNVFTQNEIGEKFYVIETGRVSVIINGENIGDLQEGASFGELALLYDCPRSATVLADTDLVLWAVDQHTFRFTLAKNANDSTTSILDVLKKVPFLSELNHNQMTTIADALVPMKYSAGKCVVRKGEIGTAFYIVKSGALKVHDIGHGQSQFHENFLAPGDFFGERALMTGEPRAATVTAMDDCELLTLSKKKFDTIMGDLNVLLQKASYRRLIMSVPIFAKSNLKDNEFSTLLNLMKERTFYEDTFLNVEGKPIRNQGFYMIKSGGVQVMDNTGLITHLKAGDHFGGQVIKLARGTLSTRTVEFTEDTVCVVLTKSAIESVIGSVSRLGRPQSFMKKLKPLTLDDFTVHQKLGAGSFGLVSLIKFKEDGKLCAIKELSKAQIVKQKQTGSVVREKNIMASINHPFIIKLIATFQTKSNLYMVTDLVQGGELFKVIYDKKKEFPGVSYDAAVFYSACVHESLSHIHDRYIAFRDLKPENILVDAMGYCILIDFGFAKVVVDKTFTMCGTPEYLAREVLLSKGYTTAVDNWGLGCLIFECLAGKTPFIQSGISQMTLFRKIVGGSFLFPSYVKWSDESKDIIRKLMMKKRLERLGSMADGSDGIKNHPFFKDINFQDLVEKKIKAPWIPSIEELVPKTSLEISNKTPYEGRYSNNFEVFGPYVDVE